MKKTFYLIRHGKYENPDAVLSFTNEPPFLSLSEEGREQIDRAADFLKDKGIECIYYSPITRTKESMQVLNEKLQLDCIKEDKRLIEINFGEWQGKPIYDCIMKTGYTDNPLDGPVESPIHAGERAMSLIGELLDAPQNCFALVSHGDVIVGMIMEMQKRFTLDDYRKINIEVDKGDVFRADWEDGNWSVRKFFPEDYEIK